MTNMVKEYCWATTQAAGDRAAADQIPVWLSLYFSWTEGKYIQFRLSPDLLERNNCLSQNVSVYSYRLSSKSVYTVFMTFNVTWW
jgi:hypothetical protein